MISFEDYATHDAIGLAELVKAREVSPAELLDAALTRLGDVNPEINAVTRVMEAEARQAIERGTQGPFAGVPFLLKDIGAQMSGQPTSAGSRVFQSVVAEEDSAIVRAYRNAGLIIFGKTNTPEFGLAATTEPALFGPARNPWNLQRTTGGSSGGAAAAVAAGIVPAAHASDGGGSIRTPASCCGVVGLKPSRGRVSMSPVGEGWGGLSVQHVVTRSIRDCAAFLDIECSPAPGDPYWLAPPDKSFAEQLGLPPGRLKIGFFPESLTWGSPDPQCVRAVRDAAQLCEFLGHDVEEILLPGNVPTMALAVNVVVSANVAAMLQREAERRGAAIEEHEVERLSWSCFQDGKRLTAVQYAEAIQQLHTFARSFSGAFERCDIILLSTNGRIPYPLGYLDSDAEDLSGYAERLYTFMPNTQPFNVAGLPAISLPLGWSDDGLPIGVQFAAPLAEEGLLLRLAAQIEQARPWKDLRPPLTSPAGAGTI